MEAIQDRQLKSASEQIRALVCGLSPRWRQGWRIAVLRAFIDDSGSGGDGRFYVLAGFMATIPVWEAFADAWQSVLNAPPAIEYFKMAEANALHKDPKGQFKDFTPEERDAKVNALIGVILGHELFEASCAVSPDDYNEIMKPTLSKIPDYDSPYLVLFPSLITLFSSWEANYGHAYRGVPSDEIVIVSTDKSRATGEQPQKVDFVFDNQDDLEERARLLYVQFQNLPPFQGRIEGVSYRDDKKFLPLQAADLTAWQHRRRLCAVAEAPRPEYDRLHADPLRSYTRYMLHRSELRGRLQMIQALTQQRAAK